MLENEIKTLELLHASNTLDKVTIDSLIKKKYDYNRIASTRAGVWVNKFKALKLCEGNRAGKLLASYLKHKQKQAIITSIKDKKNNTHTKQKEILKTFHNFYEDLYKNKQIVDPDACTKYLESLNLPKLSEADKTTLGTQISEDEISKSIKTLKNNKAPGPDGFSASFYKEFDRSLTPTLLKLFNSIALEGRVSKSMGEANIIVIPKEGKDPLLTKNYRPISIINLDCKIYAKILAIRLNAILPNLISNSQVGFLKNRLSSDNTRLLCHSLEKARISPVSSVAITLDAERAFDRVSWSFLKQCMLAFNLGSTYTSMVMALYSSASARIAINGSLSEPFLLEQGTRQGCPLSPGLFLLALEPLIRDIKINEDIAGIKFGDTQVKLAAYADDILVVTENPRDSIKALIATIDRYSVHSGYKLNRDKSEVKTLNIHGNRELLGDSGLAWQPGHIKYLGIEFESTLIETLHRNETTTLGKIKNLLDTWSPRFITWWGRVESIKMMVSPIVNYLISMLPLRLSDDFHHKLDILISKFLWNGKKARISLKKLRLDKSLGGLNLTDFKLYQTASLAKQGSYWLSPPDSYTPVWLSIEQSLLSDLHPAVLLTTNLNSVPYSRSIFKNTKAALLKVDKLMEATIKRSGMVSLWNNHRILYKGKPLNYVAWISKGIYFPHQLYKHCHPLSFREIQVEYKLDSYEFYNFLKIKVALTRAKIPISPPSLLHYISTLNRLGHHVSRIYKLIRPQQSTLNKKKS